MGSSVDTLSMSLIAAPIAAISGISVAKLQVYRLQAWMSWCISIVGMGIYTLVCADSPKAFAVGVNALISVGVGIMYCESDSLDRLAGTHGIC